MSASPFILSLRESGEFLESFPERFLSTRDTEVFRTFPNGPNFITTENQNDGLRGGDLKNQRITFIQKFENKTTRSLMMMESSEPLQSTISRLPKGLLLMHLLSLKTVADLQQAILTSAEGIPNGPSEETLVEEVMEYLQAVSSIIVLFNFRKDSC
ncbi:hypothetical protein BT96DRAFT_426510 [Gymnopus androsaceus JB14]|uniref:Uncharacterized protein n=1 Tax=Gymnopus androsaceus JB14 TaxID=1447944 RepID=A0A6A4I6H6_9AGAR|nr:hypothetical protein BT96DRAFT_426510 [Gymnopus androsaceus JB14]